MAAQSYDRLEGVIWYDGKLLPWGEANLHVLSHGLHYASCVFEGERAYGGTIFKSTEHSARLKNSARILDFETRPNRVVDLGDRNSHGPSPGLALAPYGRAGWFYVKSGPPAKQSPSSSGRALESCGSPVCFSNRTFWTRVRRSSNISS